MRCVRFYTDPASGSGVCDLLTPSYTERKRRTRALTFNITCWISFKTSVWILEMIYKRFEMTWIEAYGAYGCTFNIPPVALYQDNGDNSMLTVSMAYSALITSWIDKFCVSISPIAKREIHTYVTECLPPLHLHFQHLFPYEFFIAELFSLSLSLSLSFFISLFHPGVYCSNIKQRKEGFQCWCLSKPAILWIYSICFSFIYNCFYSEFLLSFTFSLSLHSVPFVFIFLLNSGQVHFRYVTPVTFFTATVTFAADTQ